MKKLPRSFFFLIMLLLFMGTGYSQSGKVSGSVTDASTGEPLPFVNVIIMGTTMGAATDIEGVFSIINVPPGTYEVKASAIGYNGVTYQNIQVATGLTTTLDFELSSTEIELKEDVVVIAEKKLIQKDITATTSIVGEDLISELPVTEITDVLQLQAGVTVGAGGDIHLRGGRTGQIMYQIDGVPMTDAYDNSRVVDVGTNSVKELQVISGAFNAEYGQAMSGIVNIVTKDGSNDFRGSVSSYFGDFVSDKTDIFQNIDDLNPVAIKNIEGSLSGPVLPDKLFFFVNARFYETTGHLYGERIFEPTDISRENTDNGTYFIADANDPLLAPIEPRGDGDFVAMNPSTRFFGQGKLTYRLFTGYTLRYSYMYDYQNYTDYDGGRRQTPDNLLDRFRTGITNTLGINHAVSNNSFYTLNLSYFFKDYRHYLYEDVYTGNVNNPTRYIDNRLKQNPPYSFDIGGTDMSRFVRNTSTWSGKLDWETQFTQEINIKFGGEFKYHRIYFHDITLVPMTDENGNEVTPFNVMVPSITSTMHNQYLKNPTETSAYAQAKFEAFNLIFNAGVRFDMFEPDGQVLTDPSDPDIRRPVKPENQFNDLNGNGVFEPSLGETEKTIEERRAYWFRDADVKFQVSPRIGIAFPITETGVIHFSYGHFFQLPSYELLYANPEFEIADASGNVGLFGNADLEPQKTVKGEIGLQQQLSDDMAIDVTLFFEDFRNLTGTQTDAISIFGTQATYNKYANSDFGFSKGVIFKFEKRFGGGLAMNLDYTYSVTKGNASNPSDARNAILGGAAPETFIAPLNWDQTHTLNLTLAYSVPRDYGFSLIFNFFTGQPYTPQVNKNTRVTQNAFPRNSAYKPNIFNLDLRAYKDIPVGDYTFTVFMKVYNALDLDNPRGIYGDTGDPYFTFGLLEARKINPMLYYNTLDELYTNPSFFSQPRRVELGASFQF
jgi:hypothetical protein